MVERNRIVFMALLLVTALVPLTANGQGEPGTQKSKEVCTWTQNGVASPANVGALPQGTGVGSQILTLTCPNHIELGEPQYGYKECRSPLPTGCVAPAGDISVRDLGRKDDAKLLDPTTGHAVSCGWSRSWEVTSPSVNTYVFWFRVHTLKDADCDKKPDDWNVEEFEPLQDKPEPNIWRQSNTIPPVTYNYGDGSLDGNPCRWHNTFYGGRIFNKPEAGGGQVDPRGPFYAPSPDGEVNECDWQTYEWQWRQFN